MVYKEDNHDLVGLIPEMEGWVFGGKSNITHQNNWGKKKKENSYDHLGSCGKKNLIKLNICS